MSGWPSRIFKSMLGATLRDARPVENPEIEWAARYIELLKHTATGTALVTARVQLCAEWITETSSFTIHHQAEAWNVNNALAHPTLERSGAGDYVYTFAASYPDMDGASVPFDARGFRVSECVTQGVLAGTIMGYCYAAPASHALHIYLKEISGGTPVDCPFWLEVL